MTIDLTDTSTGAIHEALSQARRRMGGPASGTVLTLIIVTDESEQYDAVRAASQAGREHPSRILAVITRKPKGESRLAYLNDYLTGREFLLDRFSVADAYLYTVLNWSMATPVKFDRFPAIQAYYTRLQKRPSIAQAFGEELALYKAELARHKAAA